MFVTRIYHNPRMSLFSPSHGDTDMPCAMTELEDTRMTMIQHDNHHELVPRHDFWSHGHDDMLRKPWTGCTVFVKRNQHAHELGLNMLDLDCDDESSAVKAIVNAGLWPASPPADNLEKTHDDMVAQLRHDPSLEPSDRLDPSSDLSAVTSERTDLNATTLVSHLGDTSETAWVTAEVLRQTHTAPQKMWNDWSTRFDAMTLRKMSPYALHVQVQATGQVIVKFYPWELAFQSLEQPWIGETWGWIKRSW